MENRTGRRKILPEGPKERCGMLYFWFGKRMTQENWRENLIRVFCKKSHTRTHKKKTFQELILGMECLDTGTLHKISSSDFITEI